MGRDLPEVPSALNDDDEDPTIRIEVTRLPGRRPLLVPDDLTPPLFNVNQGDSE